MADAFDAEADAGIKEILEGLKPGRSSGGPAHQQRKLHFIEPHKLQGAHIPAREWAVEDWLPIGACTANFGDGGTGKTLLSQQLMTSVATGKPWLGLATMRSKAIGLFCEDDEAELHRRQDRINRAYGLEFDDLDDMMWASAIGADNELVKFDPDGRVHLTERFENFKDEAIVFGARLLVIDTAADTFGDNENDKSRVRRFIGKLNGLAHEMQATVLLNCHPSKSGMSAGGDQDGGSAAWSNTVRSRLSLERPKKDKADEADLNPNARILSRRKANYAARGEVIDLVWQDGVLRPVPMHGGLAAMAKDATAEATFLELLAKFDAEGRAVSDSRTASTSAARLFAERPDRNGVSKADFERAMERLFQSGKIRMEEYGRAAGRGRPRRIVKVAAC